jgi:hypothetical protein
MDSSTFAISVVQNVEVGYTDTLCVKCENSVGSSTQHDNWKIVQNRNCATALASAVQGSPLIDQTVTYAANSALVTKASGFADFFTNPFIATCNAISACSLKASGCSGSYDDGNLVITSSTGEITAAQNIDAGYEDTVCIECQNEAGSII